MDAPEWMDGFLRGIDRICAAGQAVIEAYDHERDDGLHQAVERLRAALIAWDEFTKRREPVDG